jgi:hypothetical protein
VPLKTHGLNFNLLVSADCEPTSTSRTSSNELRQNMNVHAQTKNRRDDLIPVIVTVIVAVVGMAGILNNLRPGNDSQDSDKARMITSAAVSRAGAIEIPSEPPADRRQRGVST